MATGPRLALLEHDPTDPPALLAEWLDEAGAQVTVLHLHAGEPVPADPRAWDGIISLGGVFGARDDDRAPWLPATRALLAAAVTTGTPTLGIGLGAQLLALATGGTVERGEAGPEIGAYLAAKRDVTEFDLVFGQVPISPDVMQFHQDVISRLPPGAVLMLSSPGYPNQAFRVGSAAWGTQFHVETTAADIRRWRAEATRGGESAGGDDAAGGDAVAGGGDAAEGDGVVGGHAVAGASADDAAPAVAIPVRVVSAEDLARTERRCGDMLDEAEAAQRVVWRAFVERFVSAACDGVPQTPTGWAGPRLPITGSDGTG